MSRQGNLDEGLVGWLTIEEVRERIQPALDNGWTPCVCDLEVNTSNYIHECRVCKVALERGSLQVRVVFEQWYEDQGRLHRRLNQVLLCVENHQGCILRGAVRSCGPEA